MVHRIFESEQFRRDLLALGESTRARIEEKLRRHVYPGLRENPRYGSNIKRLRGYEPPTWRFRVGKWRFFYSIDDAERIVFMLAAEPRDHAYR